MLPNLDPYASAALSVGEMKQPQLLDCSWYLAEIDYKRYQEKGKMMTQDHLKQEARKWFDSRVSS